MYVLHVKTRTRERKWLWRVRTRKNKRVAFLICDGHLGAVLGTTGGGGEKGGGDLILIEYQRGSGEGEDGTNALYGACEL